MIESWEGMTDGLDTLSSLVQDDLTRIDLMEHAMKLLSTRHCHGLIHCIDEGSSTEVIEYFSFFGHCSAYSENIIIALTGVTLGFIDIGSRSDDGRDTSLDELSWLHIADLVSESYLVSCFDELGNILIDAVVWHPCHRDGMVRGLVLGSEDEIQEFATELCIFSKHFIEVSQTKKKNTIGILLL